MWNDIPPLVDARGPMNIPPPAGAVMGGQPDFHGAYPGFQQQQQRQQPPNWLQPQGTPWPQATAPSWANIPAQGWGNTAGGSGWANTPAPSPWPQQQAQQQQQQPGWMPQMPRQGWGPAPQGTPAPAGWGTERTPWDLPPPHSAPAGSHAHGFSATAAPPESASGQPVMGTSWFGAAAGGAHWPGMAGMTPGMMPGQPGMTPGTMPGMRPMLPDDDDSTLAGEEFYDYEAEEERARQDDVVARWQRQQQSAGQGQGQGDPRAGWPQPPDPRAGWPQTPDPRATWPQTSDPRATWPQTPDPRAAWPQAPDPRAAWPQTPDPRAAWAQDPRGAWPTQDDLMLARAHSQGQPSPGGKKKKRANSLGRGQLASWGAPGTLDFDERHLSPRPDDWRPDYSPRSGVGGDLTLASLFRAKRSDSGEFADTRKRSLCRTLIYSGSRPPIAYDVRRPPALTSFFGAFRPAHAADFSQHALAPAAPRMRLVHARLPWYIDVKHGQGVTLLDVLQALYEQLDVPIASRDFYCEALQRRDRDALTSAFKERCSMEGRERAREEMAKGVKRVDFLGDEVVFVGLVRRGAMWEIKTTDMH
ncbi:hypothetical protein B0H15DRAFT_379950 [Mycena belliarum]|uniref:DUF6699 domain-containing protein n=1 Tax=Mycena belliarum TaxID=1033014 RepID=A0AAD6U1M8_9AGAR|nr:hypothetical protein B0H15DRAFT_379950 [Mycena belliae]